MFIVEPPPQEHLGGKKMQVVEQYILNAPICEDDDNNNKWDYAIFY